jgi:2,5-diketo-D-gluconate reductase A
VFVTTKLWNDAQGTALVAPALEHSLDRLGLDYLDLYLIHWPMPMRDLYVESWRELIRLKESGRIRSIGVSNFTIAQLERLIAETGVVPAVNQVEAHPYFQQGELHAFHRRHGIVTQAWSPFGAGGRGTVGRLLDDPAILAIAAKHAVSPSRVVLRWHVALGMSVIPKATSEQHLAENLATFAVELDAEDLVALAALDRVDGRVGADPMTMDYAGRRTAE